MGTVHSPLDADQLRLVGEARRRRRRLDVAAGVAAFNGWSTAACAALTLLLAAVMPVAVVAAVVLGGLAFVELHGRARLKRFEDRGLVLLAANQAAFMALLCGYSLWRIAAVFLFPGAYTEELAAYPELAEVGLDMDQLVRVLVVAIYGGVILGSLAFNGGCVIYYLTRRRHLRDYLAETPTWVRELEQR